MIRFVGRVRGGDSGHPELSPALAEQLILSALRNIPLTGQPDETATAYTQFVLLRALVSGLDDEQLITLLSAAADCGTGVLVCCGRFPLLEFNAA